MEKTGFLHHMGTFMLFASFVLLLVVSLSSPTVNDLSLLRVSLTNGSYVTFGSFGACITQNGPDDCTDSHVGYNPAAILNRIDGVEFSNASEKTYSVLTRAMILHPIACGFAFLAFASAAGAGICGTIIGVLLSWFTAGLTITAMIFDIVWTSIIRRHVNNSDNNQGGSTAYYRECIWFIIVAVILSLIGSAVVLLTYRSSRKKRRQAMNDKSYFRTSERKYFWSLT